ncbi:hypothetical protein WDU94_007915 [Cyamophila willieti]
MSAAPTKKPCTMGDNFLLPIWFILAVRILHLSLVRSWFVPDEYWQSLEVAHNIVFGYGYMTWEWVEGIRSYLYVAFIASQYYLLHFLHLDYVQLLIFLPRLIQTLVSVLADVYLIRWICLMSSPPVAWLASLMSLASACIAYCATRTLINTIEMNLTCFALYYYPWPHVKRKFDTKYLWIVGFCCILRPTSCILWTPLCLYDVIRSQSPLRRLFHHFIPVGLSCLLCCILLDSWFHGGFLLTPWNFLRLNILSGVSGHYSTHPWHWYITAGIPSVLGTMSLPFYVYGVKAMVRGKCHHSALCGALVWSLLVYSCIGHKEFRFLLSLCPIMLLYASLQLYSWSQSISPGWMFTLVSCFIFMETALLLFLSLFHQVGSLNVMSFLRDRNISGSEGGILFLMPCHSTPLYSHLHINISTRILTCEPNLSPSITQYKTRLMSSTRTLYTGSIHTMGT